MSDKNDIAVRVEGLGKRFNLQARQTSLGEAISNRLQRLGTSLRNLGSGAGTKAGEPAEEFWAVRDISFELRHGEVLGIIGQNGAGKSTLLKILAQVLTPTAGRAELYGRVGSLLEVGTGFNPELSGRENIFLYGSILGMGRADIAKRFDEIVAFAEIERFLDQPIKHYSSGMHSRLGFSVAAHLECDILLVDEVLAVGDAAFRAKCLGKMQDVTGQGRAVIFVSHNMSAINNMCDHGIVLQHGQIAFAGSAGSATEFYMNEAAEQTSRSAENPVRFEMDESKPIQFKSVKICGEDGQPAITFDRNEAVSFVYEIVLRSPSLDYYASLMLRDQAGNLLIYSTDEDEIPSHIAQAEPGPYTYKITIPRKLLRPGRYTVTPGLERRLDGRVDKHDDLLAFHVDDRSSHKAMRGTWHRQNLIFPEIGWSLSKAASLQPEREQVISED